MRNGTPKCKVLKRGGRRAESESFRLFCSCYGIEDCSRPVSRMCGGFALNEPLKKDAVMKFWTTVVSVAALLGCGGGSEPNNTPADSNVDHDQQQQVGTPSKQAALAKGADADSKLTKTRSESGENHSTAGVADPKEFVQAVVQTLAAKDYEAFKKLTCLGMKKDVFKQFKSQSRERKVVRVWDETQDDFQAELKTDMREAFQEMLKEAEEEGFDWSQATVTECEVSDDVKAELVSGSVKIQLHLDDCIVTPKGLLMFDGPKCRAVRR